MPNNPIDLIDELSSRLAFLSAATSAFVDHSEELTSKTLQGMFFYTFDLEDLTQKIEQLLLEERKTTSHKEPCI